MLELRKLAWIRDNVPPGQPAPGHLDCPCGTSVSVPEYGKGLHTCTGCGQIYDGKGWKADDPCAGSLF